MDALTRIVVPWGFSWGLKPRLGAVPVQHLNSRIKSNQEDNSPSVHNSSKNGMENRTPNIVIALLVQIPPFSFPTVLNSETEKIHPRPHFLYCDRLALPPIQAII